MAITYNSPISFFQILETLNQHEEPQTLSPESSEHVIPIENNSSSTLIVESTNAINMTDPLPDTDEPEVSMHTDELDAIQSVLCKLSLYIVLQKLILMCNLAEHTSLPLPPPMDELPALPLLQSEEVLSKSQLLLI